MRTQFSIRMPKQDPQGVPAAALLTATSVRLRLRLPLLRLRLLLAWHHQSNHVSVPVLVQLVLLLEQAVGKLQQVVEKLRAVVKLAAEKLLQNCLRLLLHAQTARTRGNERIKAGFPTGKSSTVGAATLAPKSGPTRTITIGTLEIIRAR